MNRTPWTERRKRRRGPAWHRARVTTLAVLPLLATCAGTLSVVPLELQPPATQLARGPRASEVDPSSGAMP